MAEELPFSNISKTWHQKVSLVNKDREKIDAVQLFAQNILVLSLKINIQKQII